MAVFTAGSFPPDAFWDYSTRLYAKPVVTTVCLDLQDRCGLDVNVLLFCCWVAASGRGGFRDGELAAALSAVSEWHGQVATPVRALRRYLRGNTGQTPRRLADDLGRVVAECEIYAEHVEQLILSGSLGRPGTGTFDPAEQARAAAGNLAAYFEAATADAEPEDRKAIAELLKAAFPDAADWLIRELSGIA